MPIILMLQILGEIQIGKNFCKSFDKWKEERRNMQEDLGKIALVNINYGKYFLRKEKRPLRNQAPPKFWQVSATDVSQLDCLL